MSPEIVAALIAIGGTAVIALMSSTAAQIYFAGRLVEQVGDLKRRMAQNETVTGELVRDVAQLKGKEQLA